MTRRRRKPEPTGPRRPGVPGLAHQLFGRDYGHEDLDLASAIDARTDGELLGLKGVQVKTLQGLRDWSRHILWGEQARGWAVRAWVPADPVAVLVGQSPPRTADRRAAPFELGPSATRLQTLAGLSGPAFRATFATANCLLTWAGADGRGLDLFPRDLARAGARELLALFGSFPLVLLGRQVERAFVTELGGCEGLLPWATWVEFEPGTGAEQYPRCFLHPRHKVRIAVLPHPNGNSRALTDVLIAGRTEELLRELVRRVD